MTTQQMLDILFVVALVVWLVAFLLVIQFYGSQPLLRRLQQQDHAQAQKAANLRYYVEELENVCTPEQRQVAASRAQVRAWEDDNDDEVQA